MFLATIGIIYSRRETYIGFDIPVLPSRRAEIFGFEYRVVLFLFKYLMQCIVPCSRS